MAFGDISNVLDTQVITGEDARFPRLVHINSGYIAVMCHDFADDEGHIYTYSIDSKGAIANSATDSWAFSAYGRYAGITNIASDKYLLGYEPGDGSDAVIKSITISNTGAITESFIDTLTLSGRFQSNSMYFYKIGGTNNIWLAATREGIIHSFACDDAGNIGASVIDTEDFLKTNRGNIVNIANNYFVNVMANEIFTYSVDEDGNITPVDTWEFTTEGGVAPNIIKVPNTTKYIIGYGQSGDTGTLLTVNISNTGIITENIINTLIFEDGRIDSAVSLTHVGDYMFAITGGNIPGAATYTFACYSNGMLSAATIDSLQWIDTTYEGSRIHMIYVFDDIYVAVYRAPDTKIVIKTFSISAPRVLKAFRFEDEGGAVIGNSSTKGGATATSIKQLPYAGLSILPDDANNIENIIPKEINNPIWSLSEFLVRQDNPWDTGLLDHLIPMVNKVILPGTKYTSLELGDMIDYDNDGFIARGITSYSESFTDKVYLITNLVVKEDGIVINNTVEVNQNSLGSPFDIADDYPNPFN